MMEPMHAMWFLTLAALFASIFALVVAFRTSDPSLSRRLSGLSTSLKEAEATLDELSAQLKAMRQRENMRAYRDRKRAGAEDEEPAAEPARRGQSNRDWVQEMNERLARARLGVPAK